MAGTSRAVAKIAVSAATYWIDRPYDYLVPEELAEKAVPGARVYVPFARGNRRCEGIILARTDHSEFQQLKPVLAVLDDEPVLSAEQIRLALFMRERASRARSCRLGLNGSRRSRKARRCLGVQKR